MISNILYTLSRGLDVLRSNSRLLFVAVLIFVFPVLFIFVTQSFYETAYDNIQTAQKERVGMLHDSLVAFIRTNGVTDGLKNLATQEAQQNEDITEIRIVEKTPAGLRIEESLDPTAIGTLEKSTELYDKAALASDKTSFIYEFTQSGARMWQVIRPVVTSDGHQYFLLTEHSLKKVDDAMAGRRLVSYAGLGAIFLFLLALAYWFFRQIDWRKKHDKLQEQLHERDLFTNMITHEFRTPLTAINGFSSFLAESTNLSLDEHHYVDNIQVSAGRLLALVNDFLEVARIQSGKLSLELRSQNINPTLFGVVETLKQTATDKNLALSYTPSTNPLIHITDSKRLHQVIQNLVSNSIKYTEKGSVEIVCEQTPLATTIRIKDTGMGISADDQQKLFAPFSRVGGVEKTGITGTGLGMWITKQLVEALGGAITVESIKDVGTHVVVTLKR
jgi:signal transduction histidine kinase